MKNAPRGDPLRTIKNLYYLKAMCLNQLIDLIRLNFKERI